MSTTATFFLICNPDGTFRHKATQNGGQGSGFNVPAVKPGCLYHAENEALKRAPSGSQVVPVTVTFESPFGAAPAPIRPKALSGPALKLVRALKAQGFRDGGESGSHKILSGPGWKQTVYYSAQDGPEAIGVRTSGETIFMNHAAAWDAFQAGTLFGPAPAAESLASKLLK